MINNTSKKEKERQDEIKEGMTSFVDDETRSYWEDTAENHKQSLINFKEYLEETHKHIEPLCDWLDVTVADNNQAAEMKCKVLAEGINFKEIIEEDIKEIAKMIEAYE